MSARFEPPFIQDNPTGWGPNTIPAQFKDMVSDILKNWQNSSRSFNAKHKL